MAQEYRVTETAALQWAGVSLAAHNSKKPTSHPQNAFNIAGHPAVEADFGCSSIPRFPYKADAKDRPFF